jgi:hypothetical protein
MPDAISGVLSGAGTGTTLAGPWGAAAGAIIGGLASWIGTSDQEDAIKDMQKKLKENEEYFKSTPFSKDEIMNIMLPEAQKIYRGAADVVAGKAGAAVGESGLSGGQGFAEYYTQALAPIIAQGENQAAGAIGEFGQWYSTLDAQAKSRFAQVLGIEMQNNQSLPDMTEFQQLVSGAMSGANIGGNIAGSFDKLNAINNKSIAQDKLIDTQSSDLFKQAGVAQQQNTFPDPNATNNLVRSR